jgi:hypothetical protein
MDIFDDEDVERYYAMAIHHKDLRLETIAKKQKERKKKFERMGV